MKNLFFPAALLLLMSNNAQAQTYHQYNIGSLTSNTDANASTAYGTYDVTIGNGTGNVNYPSGAYPYGNLINFSSSNFLTQFYVGNTQSGFYLRSKYGSTYTPWARVWTTLDFTSASFLPLSGGNITGVNNSANKVLNITSPDGHFAFLSSSLGNGNYNPIVQTGDQGLIFSSSSASAGTGAFCLSPWSASTSGLRITANGNVGIGTAAPGSLLEVKTPIDAFSTGTQLVGAVDIGWTNDYGSGGAAQWLLLAPYIASGTSANPAAGLNGTLTFYRGSTSSGNIAADYHVNIQAAYGNTLSSLVPLSASSPVIAFHVVTYSGATFVAINPADLSGSHSAGNFSYFGHYWNNYASPQNIKPTLILQSAATENTSLLQGFQPVSSGAMYVNTQNFIGIGTTAPATSLHIANNNTTLNAANFITIDNRGANASYTTTHVVGGIMFAGFRDVSNPANIAGIWGVRSSNCGGLCSQGDIVFGTIGTSDYGENIAQNGVLPAERMRINYLGNVGIGTATPSQSLEVNGNVLSDGNVYIGGGNGITVGANTAGYALAVNGPAIFTKAVVKLYTTWPDYVFEPSYKLRTLSSLNTYIQENKHLPDMPAADDIKKDGVNLGETQAALLKKIEELTIYIIEQDKKSKEQQAALEKMQKEINSLKEAIKK